MPKALNKAEIKALTDQRLLAWYKSLHRVCNSGTMCEHRMEDWDRARMCWCYHEARRELTRRGVRDYSKTKSFGFTAPVEAGRKVA